MADRATHVDYGSPLNISLEYNFPGSSGNLFDVALTWANKTSTRLAESSWLSFVPVSVDETTPSWSMDIMGTPISPLEVVPGGTHWLHAVSDVGVNFSVPSSTGHCASLLCWLGRHSPCCSFVTNVKTLYGVRLAPSCWISACGPAGHAVAQPRRYRSCSPIQR